MSNKARTVISASRRTDIPAFYMPWFMKQIEQRHVETVNPYNRRTKVISLSSQHIHSIVFWSKNFGLFINGGYGEWLQKDGFNLFFNFTVNAESHFLEPQVPPLDDRLSQLNVLCTTYGAEAVTWRFDPICFYKTASGRHNNLDVFKKIANAAARFGVRRCITSFRDDYSKIQKRTAKLYGFQFIDPPLSEKAQILIRMATYLNSLGIRLYTCCENTVLDMLPPKSAIQPAACIDNRLLASLYGDDVSQKRDFGQRVKQGCRCGVSVDVGDYKQHPCYHNCLFCYANPVNTGNIETLKSCHPSLDKRGYIDRRTSGDLHF